MSLRSFDKPTTILPVVSILVIMFLPLSNLAQSVFAAAPLTLTVVPRAALCVPSLAVNVRPSFIFVFISLVTLST